MNDFNPEDPKWTAYVLGELSAEEKETLEQEFEDHPEAKKLLDELAGTQSSLRAFFEQESDLTLEPVQKGKVLVAAANPKTKTPLRVWAYPLAACLVIALAFPLLQPEKSPWKEIGTHPEQDALDGETIETIEEPRDSNIASELKESEEVHDLAEFTMEMDRLDPLLSSSDPSVAPVQPTSEVKSKSVEEDMDNVSSPVRMEGLLVGRTNRGRKAATASYDAFGGGFVSSTPSEGVTPRFLSPSQDEFDVLNRNTFRTVSDHPLSTFSIDVDTASYSVVRKMIREGRMPPKDAVRIEEMVNYFKYDYAPPRDGAPFAAHMEIAPCPWAPEHQLIRVAVKGQEIAAEERPALNLVYLLDVSGSMRGGNRLPLVKRAMKTLVRQLDERDRVAIVVYAGAAGVVLPSTSGENDRAILEALDQLTAGGSTAGGAGIQLAYNIARDQFVEGGVNRVILCTDGDFNVGLKQTGDLQTLIEKEAKSGVQFTILGFGMGNYKDDTLETLSNKGNGNYAFIDDFQEARKVLVDDLLGNMITIAKDVKIQVEFNPTYVAAYRLVGYENRMLKKEDFNNDKMDAGEIGAGHTVTAFYELVPAGAEVPDRVPAVDDLKYQKPQISSESAGTDTELLTLKLRHKHPQEEVSVKTEYPFPAIQRNFAAPGEDYRFASAVAAFGFWLRDPEFRDTMDLEKIRERAQSGRGEDPFGYRAEFIQLVRVAEGLEK